jgi:hypothetical protein
MSKDKIKTVRFKIHDKNHDNGDFLNDLKINLSKKGVKDLITKFQTESTILKYSRLSKSP